ncbi:protein NARROW LEAF 1-like isoform X1 [Nymphaea colorata]|nr:protein NARROW LEAF 1-like isoform X1 [Nymphaea colorata]
MRPSILFRPPDDTARERASFFTEVQRQLDSEEGGALPAGRQATTILDLMVIRASHSKILRRYSLGTAVGFRMRKGALTDVPAILVFVSRKVNRRWLLDCQVLPTKLVGPGGIWCDVDVVEFSYYTSHASTSREQVYTELVEGLRGSDPQIGPGSQVSSQETYGTLGMIVRSRIDSHQVGFLTNRHVAVDLDHASQKMFHPLPPNLGPGVCLGAVERTTSFVKDKLWYGIFASRSPETFVRADGAFVPFADSFDLSKVTTSVKGVGDMGEVIHVDLQAPIGTIIGKPVVKVGRSSGLTKGMILAYALEYNDDKGICYFTDFLVIGEDGQTFDLEGDSGSLILIVDDGLEKPRPIGIIWGGTENRGRLKLKDGLGLCSWTSAVDLGRLLNLLELDLVTRDEELQACFNNLTTRDAEAMEEKECISNAASVEEAPPKGCTSPITSTTGQSRDIANVEHQLMQDSHAFFEQTNLSRNLFPENISG